MGARQRHRRASRPLYADWHEPGQAGAPAPGDWRSTSPTVQSIRENADRFRVSLDAVRRGLHTARFSAVSSGKDAKLRIIQYLKALHSLKSRQAAGLASAAEKPGDRKEEAAGELQRVLRELTSKRDSQSFAAGVLLFGLLLWTAGAAPWALPWAYVAFAAVCLPLRCADFVAKKWTFFLLDFCYWANVATMLFLLLRPADPRLFVAVNALADGPLAAALIVWQSAWVFGSSAHTISVLIHQLPGLALFCLQHFPPPARLAPYLPGGGAPKGPTAGFSFAWAFAAPFAFYLGWQATYFLVVQVCCRRFIRANGYDTSYSCLARRAAKSNNFWNRTVRRGSALRRVFMFGLYQAIYTVLVLLLLLPVSRSFHLSFLWQVVKVVFPVWHGSRYICEKVPRHAVMKVWKQQQLQF